MLLAISVLFAADARYAPEAPPPFSSAGNVELPAEQAYWESRIRAVGGASAYNELAQSVRDATTIQAHMRAHAFGYALYRVSGLDGTPVCDERFSAGCFHEFFGMAISDRGVSVVSSLDTFCMQSPENRSGSCRHGIGHGIVAFFGYTPDDLEKALQLCGYVQHGDSFGACYDGAIMEYNLRLAVSDDSSKRRPFTGDPFEPCNQISDTYAAACAFSQPEWWRQELFAVGTTTAVYARMGDYCHSLSDEPDTTSACFFGVGNGAVPVADSDTSQIVRLCTAAARSQKDNLYCRAGAAIRINNQIDSARALRICNGLTGNSYIYCEAFAIGSDSIYNSQYLRRLLSDL